MFPFSFPIFSYLVDGQFINDPRFKSRSDFADYDFINVSFFLLKGNFPKIRLNLTSVGARAAESQCKWKIPRIYIRSIV